MKLKN